MTPDKHDLTPKKTPKELAKERRDRRLRNRVLLAVGALALLVIGILAYGWYDVNVRQQRQPVATVNGEKITRQEFRARVRLTQIQLINRMQQTQQLSAFFGEDEQAQQSIQQQMQQLQIQLSNPMVIGQQVLEQMIRDELIKQEAQSRGISVSEAEVDAMIQEIFGYYADGTPTPAPSRTPAATRTFDPTAAAAATATVTPTEGPSATPRPTGTITPTPTEYTLEAYEENYAAYMEALSGEGIREQDYRNFARAEIYRNKLREEFREEVPREQEQVNARHILVEDEETAQEVLDELGAGAEFAELAAEYSSDQSNAGQGGDLGWISRGDMVNAFEEAVFQGEVGEIVGPVETQFGFHVIEILDRQERPLDEAAFERAVENAFNELINNVRNKGDISVTENWVQLVPTVQGPSQLPPQ